MGGQLRPVDWDRKAMLASKEFGSSRITSIRIADPLLLLGFHSREDPESQQPREGGFWIWPSPQPRTRAAARLPQIPEQISMAMVMCTTAVSRRYCLGSA